MDRQQILKSLEPCIPFDKFIELANSIFHKYEAKYYDQIHGEIYRELPVIWEVMLSSTRELINKHPLRILDFGCGTGFEAGKILDFFGPDKIEYLFCFDISEQMLEYCRKNLDTEGLTIVFSSKKEVLSKAAREKPFDMIVTNSLLHHLPDWEGQVQKFRDMLDDFGLWINGHEPSARFYKNRDCLATFNAYLNYLQRSKYFRISAYLRKLKDIFGFSPGMYRQAADEINRLGVIKNKITPQWVGLLVDYHVPLDERDAYSSKLDPILMRQNFAPFFELKYLFTYSYMGYFFDMGIEKKWQKESARLRALYKNDGAYFCAVWKKK
jgi:SAM-dependent methyltransferase